MSARPTMLKAEEAADLLGVDLYDLAILLQYAAADDLARLSSDVRRDPDTTVSVGRARRLKAASDACYAALDAVAEARAGAAR